MKNGLCVLLFGLGVWAALAKEDAPPPTTPQTTPATPPVGVHLKVERQALKELNYGYRARQKEYDKAIDVPADDAFENKLYKDLTEFGVEFKWREVHCLKPRDRITADRLMFSNLEELFKDWPTQEFIVGQRCPPFKPPGNSKPTQFSVKLIAEVRNSYRQLLTIYMKWLGPMEASLREYKADMARATAKTPSALAESKTEAQEGAEDPNAQSEGQTQHKSYVFSIVSYISSVRKEFDQVKQKTSDQMRQWMDAVNSNNCLVRDMMAHYNILPRFINVLKNSKEKQSKFARLREIADRSVHYRSRQPDIDRVVRSMYFFFIVFREIFFIAQYVLDYPDSQQIDLLMTAGRVCVFFRENFSLHAKKIDQILAMYKTYFQEIRRTILKLENTSRIDGRRLPPMVWPMEENGTAESS